VGEPRRGELRERRLVVAVAPAALDEHVARAFQPAAAAGRRVRQRDGGLRYDERGGDRQFSS